MFYYNCNSFTDPRSDNVWCKRSVSYCNIISCSYNLLQYLVLSKQHILIDVDLTF